MTNRKAAIFLFVLGVILHALPHAKNTWPDTCALIAFSGSVVFLLHYRIQAQRHTNTQLQKLRESIQNPISDVEYVEYLKQSMQEDIEKQHQTATNTTTEYPYESKLSINSIGMLLLGLIFVSLICISMAHSALTNDRGMILEGIFRLSVQGATNFYWVFTIVFAMFVILGLIALIANLMGIKQSYLLLTPSELHLKQGLLLKPRIVPFGEITRIEIRKMHQDRCLRILHRNGIAAVFQSWLPDSAAFAQVCRTVAERTRLDF